MKGKMFIIAILILVLIGVGYKMTGNVIKESGEGDKILLKTNQGDIVIELYENMPITAGNFKKLVGDGVYDGVIFHRILNGFMIQGGDPTGTGMGDPNIPNIQDEFVEGSSNLRGTIAMANAGPNTGSSQFFINLVDNIYLDWDKQPESSKHPVFGKVVEGMDIVDKIANVKVNQAGKPDEDVKIIKASFI